MPDAPVARYLAARVRGSDLDAAVLAALPRHPQRVPGREH